MFIYNGKKLETIFIENINRKENKKTFFEIYIEGKLDEKKISVDLLFNFDSG